MEVTLCERMGGGGHTPPALSHWHCCGVPYTGAAGYVTAYVRAQQCTLASGAGVAQLDPRVLRRLLCVSLAHVPQSILAYLETHRVVIYIVRTARGFFPVVLHEVAPLALAPACCHSVFLAPVLMQPLAPSR